MFYWWWCDVQMWLKKITALRHEIAKHSFLFSRSQIISQVCNWFQPFGRGECRHNSLLTFQHSKCQMSYSGVSLCSQYCLAFRIKSSYTFFLAWEEHYYIPMNGHSILYVNLFSDSVYIPELLPHSKLGSCWMKRFEFIHTFIFCHRLIVTGSLERFELCKIWILKLTQHLKGIRKCYFWTVIIPTSMVHL